MSTVYWVSPDHDDQTLWLDTDNRLFSDKEKAHQYLDELIEFEFAAHVRREDSRRSRYEQEALAVRILVEHSDIDVGAVFPYAHKLKDYEPLAFKPVAHIVELEVED